MKVSIYTFVNKESFDKLKATHPEEAEKQLSLIITAENKVHEGALICNIKKINQDFIDYKKNNPEIPFLPEFEKNFEDIEKAIKSYEYNKNKEGSSGYIVPIDGNYNSENSNIIKVNEELLESKSNGGVKTAGDLIHTLAIKDNFDTGTSPIGAPDHRLKSVEVLVDGTIAINSTNFYSSLTTANNDQDRVSFKNNFNLKKVINNYEEASTPKLEIFNEESFQQTNNQSAPNSPTLKAYSSLKKSGEKIIAVVEDAFSGVASNPPITKEKGLLSWLSSCIIGGNEKLHASNDISNEVDLNEEFVLVSGKASELENLVRAEG